MLLLVVILAPVELGRFEALPQQWMALLNPVLSTRWAGVPGSAAKPPAPLALEALWLSCKLRLSLGLFERVARAASKSGQKLLLIALATSRIRSALAFWERHSEEYEHRELPRMTLRQP